MRKRVLPPEDTLFAKSSAAAAVGCSTPRSTLRNIVTAIGAAIRPIIGGSGNTAKCAVRIWSVSAAARNSRPNVQMPAIAATPVGKKTIENVLRMLQVLKMSTWLSVTHLPNETQSPPECGNGNSSTCYGKPSGQNEHIVFRNAARSLKIRLPRGQPDSTRNRISRSFWPTEKAGQVGGQGFANL